MYTRKTDLDNDRELGRGQRLRHQHRLIKREVVALLRQGARLGRAALAVRLAQNTHGQSRIAIAVPKRILKTAVARNRVKRAIREAFRQHAARALPIDMLVTFEGKTPDGRGATIVVPRELRETMMQLMADVARRF